jgi:hypothetical protein
MSNQRLYQVKQKKQKINFVPIIRERDDEQNLLW